MSTIDLSEDTVKNMLKYAQEFGKSNGINLDYSEASIKQLDTLLNEFHEGYSNDPNPDEESLSGLALALGIYLGESLKQNRKDIMWRYGEPAAGGPATAYLYWNGNEAYPVDWIAKHITDGTKESTFKKYELFDRKL